jgi:hypothetical protein
MLPVQTWVRRYLCEVTLQQALCAIDRLYLLSVVTTNDPAISSMHLTVNGSVVGLNRYSSYAD